MDSTRKVYLETKLRNLKRRIATIEPLISRTDEVIQLKKEIDAIDKELENI